MPQLKSVTIGDAPDAWRAAGFTVDDANTTVIGRTAIELVGSGGPRGILSLAIDELSEPIDGLPIAPGEGPNRSGPRHENRVVEFDHLVVMTPNCDRSTDALAAAGLKARRTRVFDAGGGPTRQTFFWLGDVILELVGPDAGTGDGPAQAWGVALTCDDLSAAATWLGAKAGRVKDAIQTGRQIATVRTKELDISVPIALMSPHV